MTPLPWHLDPDDHGGAWLRTADQTPVAYVTHCDDAMLILLSLRLWDAQGITIDDDVLYAFAVWEERQKKKEAL